MGAGHFFRRSPFPGDSKPFSIEHELQLAGAKTYLIVLGTNATGGYDNLDPRFDSWPTPVIVHLGDSWVGELPALPVLTGGVDVARIRFGVADALLYLGSRD